MILQYLGTGAAEGFPALFCACKQCENAWQRGGRNIRMRSQAVIYKEALGHGGPDDILLIDYPADTYANMLNHGLRLRQVGHLLVTHSHKDHFIPEELSYRNATNAKPKPEHDFHIYGNKEVKQRLLDTTARADSLLDMKFHVPECFQPFHAGAYTVTPLAAAHTSYTQEERTFIYIIEHGGKRMLYGNDTSVFPEETWDYIAGKPFDLVSLDCTYCGEKGGRNHMGMPDVLEVRARMEKLGCIMPNTRVILHHFSHNHASCHDEMVELAKPHNLEVAYDGAVWEV